jgi:VWFA-related protein
MRLTRLVGAGLSLAAAFALAQVRERVEVALVSIRVEARDKDGKPLPDLKASEIRLKVDGHDVPVEGLDRVGPTAAVAATVAAVPAGRDSGTPPADPSAPATPAPAPAAKATSDLYMGVLVDESASNSYDRREVYRQIESFLGGHSKGPGTHVMLQRYDGQLHTECPWTSDATVALAAAKKMGKRMLDASMPSPSVLREEIRKGRKARDVQLQIEMYARRSFDAVYQALLRFPNVPGRKGLVFVTDGTPLISPFDLAMMFTDNDANGRGEQSMREEMLRHKGETGAADSIEKMLQEESLSVFSNTGVAQDTTWNRLMAQITSKALELDIAFYPVDSEDPDRGTNPDASAKWVARSMPGVPIGSSSVPVAGSGMTARVAVVQTMSGLAEVTGGRAVLVPRKAADGLAEIAAGPPNEYLLSFRDPFPGDGRYHKIEIGVARPGSSAAYRRGYRVRSEEERILDTIVAHLAVPPDGNNPLSARAAMEVLREEGGRKVVEMRLEYTPAEAPGALTDERDLDVWAICSDDAGNRAKPLHRQVRATRLPGGASGYRDAFQLGLPPGPYTWSLALKDRPTGAVSYVVVRKIV